ncbi:MAG TPA: hypothetical protein VLH08_21125, partial [Acidobacteriota bacterium]|nr:hypothetical protein [Acidobacteriota bacterium]
MGKKFSVILKFNLFVFCLVTFNSAVNAREERQLGNCSTFISGRTLIVNGTEIANSIEIKSGDRLIQIICDGVTENFNGIEVVTIEAGDGDDTVNVNNNDGFLDEIKITVLGQEGHDIFEWSKVQEIRPARQTLFDHSFDGGFGDDLLLITTSVLGEKFDIVPGREENSIQVEVIDIAQKTKLADIRGSELEILNVKMGDGNDQAIISHFPEISLNILGQEGDESVTLAEIIIEILPPGPAVTVVDL